METTAETQREVISALALVASMSTSTLAASALQLCMASSVTAKATQFVIGFSL